MSCQLCCYNVSLILLLLPIINIDCYNVLYLSFALCDYYFLVLLVECLDAEITIVLLVLNSTVAISFIKEV